MMNLGCIINSRYVFVAIWTELVGERLFTGPGGGDSGEPEGRTTGCCPVW